jgi:hypothetical protein
MVMDGSARGTRRALLASAVGGAAALAAAQLTRPLAVAAATGPVNIDVENPADATTTVATTAAAAAIQGVSSASATGVGVAGRNTFVNDGSEYSNVGVFGVAGPDPIDWSPDDMESGVYGYADTSSYANGVLGVSPQGNGCYGWGDYGVIGDGGTLGVWGIAESGVGILGQAGSYPLNVPANVGVMAAAQSSGRALVVAGRTSFSRAGRTTVGKGKRYKEVSVAGGGLSATSQIVATANTLVTGTYVQATKLVSSTKFRIYLNKTAPASVGVTWIVLN